MARNSRVMAKCSRCSDQSVVTLDYVNQKLCTNCFINFFEKRVRRTIRRHGLLDPKDRVAVALSGGKDSMAALNILAKLSEKAPRSKLFAIMIDEGVRGYRDKLIATASSFCDDIGVPYNVYSFEEELGASITEIVRRAKGTKNPYPACSYCGVFRRQLLNSKARELSATKLVTGHNLDDECQTGLMNFLRGDAYRIARAGAMVGAVENDLFVPRIKPLRETPEAEVGLYTKILKIPTSYSACPYSEEAFRVSMKRAILDLECKYPGTRYQTLASIDSLTPILKEHYLELEGAEAKLCDVCGEVSSGDICKFCLMKKELGLT